jgi:hypothetical protein
VGRAGVCMCERVYVCTRARVCTCMVSIVRQRLVWG